MTCTKNWISCTRLDHEINTKDYRAIDYIYKHSNEKPYCLEDSLHLSLWLLKGFAGCIAIKVLAIYNHWTGLVDWTGGLRVKSFLWFLTNLYGCMMHYVSPKTCNLLCTEWFDAKLIWQYQMHNLGFKIVRGRGKQKLHVKDLKGQHPMLHFISWEQILVV